MLSAPRKSAVLAGCAGLGLLAVSFVGWFGVGDISSNLWESFDVADVVVAIAIASAVVTAVAALRGDSSGVPVAGSSVTTGVAAIAFALLAFRLIDPPGGTGVEREAGIWLGLAGVAAVGLLSHRGMGTSL